MSLANKPPDQDTIEVIPSVAGTSISAPGAGCVPHCEPSKSDGISFLHSDGTDGLLLGSNTFDFALGVTSPTIKQRSAPVDTAGQALTIYAQAGGAKSATADGAGGNLVLKSGAGGGSAAAGSVVIQNGSKATLTIADAGTFTIGATVASPTITQANAAVDTAGQALLIRSQAGGAKDKTADGAGGDVTIQTGAGGGSAAAGALTFKVGATTVLAADGAGKLGFYGAAPYAKPTVLGSKSDAVAVSILTALVNLGLVTDSTT